MKQQQSIACPWCHSIHGRHTPCAAGPDKADQRRDEKIALAICVAIVCVMTLWFMIVLFGGL